MDQFRGGEGALASGAPYIDAPGIQVDSLLSAQPEPETHEVVDLAVNRCIHIQVEARDAPAEVNRQVAVHQHAAEHDIEAERIV